MEKSRFRFGTLVLLCLTLGPDRARGSSQSPALSSLRSLSTKLQAGFSSADVFFIERAYAARKKRTPSRALPAKREVEIK